MSAFTDFVLKNTNVPLGNGLVGVEIGVRDGVNSLEFFNCIPIKRLFLVDDLQPYFDAPAREYTKEDQEGEFTKLMRNMAGHYERTVFVRQSSELALDTFKDLRFDFIYIDGNHALDFVKKDLRWHKLLQPGGIIGGHDYGGYAGDDVKLAVDELAKDNDVVVNDLGGRTNGGGGVEWAMIKTKQWIEK